MSVTTQQPHDAARPLVIGLLGDVMVDIVVTLSGEIRRGTDTAAVTTFRGGGSAANTAAWLGVNGYGPTMIGAVGGDSFGDAATAELVHDGVAADIQRVHGVSTGSVVALVHPGGERTMFPDAGANLHLSHAHVTAALASLVERATDSDHRAHLHVSGYTLLRPETRDVARSAIDWARAHSMTTSVDPSSTGPIQDVGIPQARQLFADVDLMLANNDEAHVLTGVADPERAATLLQALATTVIVKCGPDGALAASSEGITRCAAQPVHVVDTLGAGDSFAAGALPAWIAGAPIAQVLRAGAERAAECVQISGARPPKRQ